MLAPRFAGGLGAAVTTGMLAAATVPAQAAAMPGMGLQATLHGSHAYPRAGGPPPMSPGIAAVGWRSTSLTRPIWPG